MSFNTDDVDAKQPRHVQQPAGRSCCRMVMLVVLVMMGVCGAVVYFLPSLIGHGYVVINFIGICFVKP